MGKAPKTRRPGGRTADTTRRIFDATTALLVEGGYQAVTFQLVAERAKVGRATLYRRWPGLPDLVGDAVRATAAEQIAIPDAGSLRADLITLLSELAAFLTSPLGRAAMAASLTSAVPTDDVSADELRWTERWLDVEPIFDRAEQRGELPGGIDRQIAFAKSAGAIYFRTIAMNLPVDAKWIERVADDLIGRGKAG